MWTAPRLSLVIASQPRLPATSVPGTVVDGAKLRAPSRDSAVSNRVPVVPFAVHTIVSLGAAPATGVKAARGGCSALTRASPAALLTRVGGANARPPSRLIVA